MYFIMSSECAQSTAHNSGQLM